MKFRFTESILVQSPISFRLRDFPGGSPGRLKPAITVATSLWSTAQALVDSRYRQKTLISIGSARLLMQLPDSFRNH